jgi:hypothetical protein
MLDVLQFSTYGECVVQRRNNRLGSLVAARDRDSNWASLGAPGAEKNELSILNMVMLLETLGRITGGAYVRSRTQIAERRKASGGETDSRYSAAGGYLNSLETQVCITIPGMPSTAHVVCELARVINLSTGGVEKLVRALFNKDEKLSAADWGFGTREGQEKENDEEYRLDSWFRRLCSP